MILLVDAGNSRIKWCSYVPRDLIEFGEARHAHQDVGAVTKAAWAGLDPPRKVLVANVAGADAALGLARAATDLWGIQPKFLRSERECCGVTNGYPDGGTLGVDRWVALIGARTLAAGAFGVVDCGTAITMDYVDANGLHRGGVILPGVRLMRRSLASSTGDLPMVAEVDAPVLATNTIQGIAAGTIHAAAWSIHMFRESVESMNSDPVSWFLTGGGGGELRSLLSADFRYDPHLVLTGLKVFADAATNGAP